MQDNLKNTAQYFDCNFQGYKALDNLELKNTYVLEKSIGKGAYGRIFKVKDMPYAIKFQLDSKTLANEIKALKSMQKKNGSLGVTMVIDYDIVILKNFGKDYKKEIVAGWFVMPLYEQNLDSYISKCKNNQLSAQEISNIGIGLLESLQTIHSTARTFNDLKPENIMIDGSTDKVVLIDFGLVDKFKDSQGRHCPEDEQTDEFKGNLFFSTVNQLEFKKSSRKDDLISLTYLLVYLLNKKKMPLNFNKIFIDIQEPIKQLEACKQFKEIYSLSQIYKNVKYAPEHNKLQMQKFMKKITQLKYTEKPDYEELKNILRSWSTKSERSFLPKLVL